MKTLLLICFCIVLFNTKSANAFYAHIYGPNYTCPNSQLSYYYTDDYGGGDVEITVTHGQIFNEITQTWVNYWTFYEGDYTYGSQSLPFKIKWDNSANGVIGNVHIRVCDHTATFICSNGDRNVTFGPSPGIPTISGSDYLLNCQSQQQNYTAVNLPESWQLSNWTLSSNLQKIGTSISPITIKATSTTYQGMETLTGVFNFTTGGNTCGTQNVGKNIWLGAPSPSSKTVDGSSYYSGYQLCPGSHWVGISWNGLVTSTNWHVFTGGSYYTTNTQCNFTLDVNSSSSFMITVSGNNTCGTSSTASYYLSKKTYGCGSYLVATFPNPTNGELTIQTTFLNEDELQTEVIPDEIILIDKFNQKAVDNIPNNSIFLLDTKDIPNGEYFLKVRFGKEEVVSRVIIKK